MSGQAGAPEIKITLAMVEKGCLVLQESGRLAFENDVLDRELARELLLTVFPQDYVEHKNIG